MKSEGIFSGAGAAGRGLAFRAKKSTIRFKVTTLDV